MLAENSRKMHIVPGSGFRWELSWRVWSPAGYHGCRPHVWCHPAELPQDRKVARVSGLWQVRVGLFCARRSCPHTLARTSSAAEASKGRLLNFGRFSARCVS